jgi:2-dehydro-3-deoxyphosphooctonate aldolase (KDO 8-P synthase)
MMKVVSIEKVNIGGNNPFVLIAGPCVIENAATVLKTASEIKGVTDRLKIPFIFKASYDKANRTSLGSFRGLGMKKGLAVLKEVKDRWGLPILSDVHAVSEVAAAAKVLDVLQIPAFLCRQTDLLIAAARTGKAVNVKKGQFLAPWDMKSVVQKIASQKNEQILLTERGTSFGYNNLVSDFRSLAIMRQWGYPVIFDASHSVQQPGGLGHASGGERAFIPLLARCGVAAGCDGIFLETHPDPKRALSDGPNMLPLKQLESLLVELIAIDTVVKRKNVFKG